MEQKDIDALLATLQVKTGTDVNSLFADYTPITGGNLVSTELYKIMYESATAGLWNWLIIFQRYFSNLWKIENATRQEQKAFKHYMITKFWFGAAALFKDSKGIKAYGITPLRVDANMEILEANVWVNNLQFIGNAFKEVINTKVRENDKIVFGKLNYNALPMVIQIWGMCENIETLLAAFKTNLLFNAKKLKYRVRNNNTSILKEEVGSVLNPYSPVVIEIINDDGEPNKFEDMSFPNTGNIAVIDQIKSYLGLIQTYLGIYGEHANFKRERNISAEFTGEEVQIQMQLREMEQELEYEIDEANEKFDKKWRLVNVATEVKEEQDEKVQTTNTESTSVQRPNE